MTKKSIISNTKIAKSLDITTVSNRPPNATTRPTILNHTKTVTDPMINHHDVNQVDTTSNDELSSDETVSSDSYNNYDDIENTEEKNTTISADIEDISSLVKGKKYYIHIESPKTRKVAFWIVALSLLSVGIFVFLANKIK
jgi:hypothetical protein